MFPSLPPSYIVTWRRVLLRHGVALETEEKKRSLLTFFNIQPGRRDGRKILQNFAQLFCLDYLALYNQQTQWNIANLASHSDSKNTKN